MKKLLLSILIFFGILFSFTVFAADAPGIVTIDTSLPGPYNVATTGPVGAIGNIYYFAMALGGLLAFGSIVFAGIKWTASRGNSSSISDAKDQITQALIGLLLLMGSFIVLNTINPQLTILKFPQLTPIPLASSTAGGGGAASSTCPGIDPLTPIADFGPQAVAMEGGQTVIWNAPDSGTQANLDILHGEYNRLQVLSHTAPNNFSATANSVYRPAGYQTHLREIMQRSVKLVAMSQADYDNNPGCQDLNVAVRAEENKHKICRGSSQGICVVAQNSPHTAGNAVDLQLTNITAAALNTLLRANGYRLHLAPITGDPVHFVI